MNGKTNNLEILSRCPICKSKFKPNDLSLVLEKEFKTIFHATCSKCQTSSLILLSSGSKGLLGVGIITDLDKSEVKKKLNTKAITADEIIDVYKLLKS